jgi:hypothetical protein
LRAEELGERRIHQCCGAIVGRGQQGSGVYRHNGAGVLERIAAEPGIGRELEKPAWPEAQLLGVHIERVIHVTPEIAARIAAAAHDDLWGQQQVDVEHYPLLSKFVAQPAPVAGEARPRQNVPAPGGRHLDLLGARRMREDDERQPNEQAPRQPSPV